MNQQTVTIRNLLPHLPDINKFDEEDLLSDEDGEESDLSDVGSLYSRRETVLKMA